MKSARAAALLVGACMHEMQGRVCARARACLYRVTCVSLSVVNHSDNNVKYERRLGLAGGDMSDSERTRNGASLGNCG